MNDNQMTKADRANLERLARKRGKVAASMIGERVKKLRAEVDDQLAAEYEFDDELWADLNREAQQAAARADQHIAAKCVELAIPENLRPRVSIGWSGRGENALASRRAELRRAAFARIDAAAETAKVQIEQATVAVETELIRDGLETAEAIKFVDAMPTVEQLMPPVAVPALDPGKLPTADDDDRYAYRHRLDWEPPEAQVAGLLLSTASPGTRQAKRAAVEALLTANPEASLREIARQAGVDHHTVARVRGAITSGNAPDAPANAPGDPADAPADDDDGGAP